MTVAGIPEDLGLHCVPENTPENRWAMTNVPASARNWSLASHPRSDVDAEVLEWAEKWISRPDPRPFGLIFWGEAGTGKTGLVYGILRVAAERGDGDRGIWNILSLCRAKNLAGSRKPAPVWIESWVEFLARLRRARGEFADERLIDEVDSRADLLAFDDLDIGGPVTSWRESVLLRFLTRPERGQRLILTTNAAPQSFAERFGERCADRMLAESSFALIALHGRSFRRKLG